MAPPLLRLEQLGVRYGSLWGVRQLSLEVGAGECVALLGSNGAGKSTTLRAISRLVPASEGQLYWGDRSLRGLSTEATVRLGISHCPEGRRVLAQQTVLDNLQLGAWLRRDRSAIAADLERLTGGLRRQAEVLFSNQDEDGVRSMYRKALADYGNDAATFKALAQDYFAFFQADKVRAVKACHELESTCRRSVGRGKGDWFDVLSQNSAWRLVASFYRKAGDEKKAYLIERDCDSREKAAKQKAI
jgi:ABC-type sugar transport system ATPase subunit